MDEGNIYYYYNNYNKFNNMLNNLNEKNITINLLIKVPGIDQLQPHK